MARSVRSAALFGLMAGLATVAVAEAVRPRGGSSLLLDWGEVRERARGWLSSATTSRSDLDAAARDYRKMAATLERPLLDFVGGMPAGTVLPEFAALDRTGWRINDFYDLHVSLDFDCRDASGDTAAGHLATDHCH